MESTDRSGRSDRPVAPTDEQDVETSMERADIANGEVPDDAKEQAGTREAAKRTPGRHLTGERQAQRNRELDPPA
jgi:hypothetical protein